MTRKISVTINGKPFSHEVEPRLLLIHYLRETAGITGPHIGCETSICGACTVMLDGRAVIAERDTTAPDSFFDSISPLGWLRRAINANHERR